MTTVRGNGGAGGVGRSGALQPRSAMMSVMAKRVEKGNRIDICEIILRLMWEFAKCFQTGKVGVSVT